jgi:hypothetical protein
MFDTDGRCYVHNFELAEARCRNCGYEFCAECLVYAFGVSKPPYCVACALAAAGVRSNAARTPTMSRREIRRLEKERKRAEREKAAKTGPRVAVEPLEWPDPALAQDAPAAPEDPFAWADRPDGGQRVPY